MGRWTGLGAVVAVVSSVLVIGLGSGSATAAPAPPEIVGGFDDNSLVVGQTGTLLFKITNPNTTDPLTGVNFDTNLPSALDLDTVTSTTDCDPTPEVIGSTDRFNITDATLAANTACAITINFTTTAAGTAGTSGADHIIILSDLTTNETTPTPEPDIGTLTITDPTPPAIVGGFTASPLVVGQTGTLAYTLTNSNPVPLTGVNFDTNLPSALDLDTVTSTTDCDPTPEVIGSTDRFNITDATLAANTACAITINFTTTAAGTAGTSGADHIIILSDLTTNETTPTPEPDIGTLTITDPTPPAIVGGFTASPLVVGQTGTLAYTLTNSNPVPLTGVNFDTNLPSALDLDTVTSTTDCDPTPEVIGSTDRFNITDATLAANTACAITINFTTTAAGTAGTSGADHIIILSDLTTNETTPTPEPDIGTLIVNDPSANVPDAPTGVMATPLDGAATVSWTAPADGGSPILGYGVQQSLNGGTTWTTVIADTGTQTTQYTVMGLTNGVPVEFRVRALNIVGTSTPSTTTGQVTPATTPNPPTGAAATPADESATVTWTAPADDGGAAITGYRIEQSTNGGTTWTTAIANTATTATQATITGLTNGIPVEFRISAINPLGTSTPSTTTGQVTPATTPNPPTGAAATPADESATVTWTAPADDGGAAITGYRIEQSTNGGTTWTTAIANTATTATQATITGLTNGIPVEFRISAINPLGTSTPSTTTGQVTPSAPPPPDTELFVPVAPLRLVDTRPSGTKVGALDGSGEPLRINVLGKAGLPTTGVGAVSLNVTAVDGEIGPIGFVTVDGCTSPRPVASNLNFITGQTVPNAVITPVSPTGEICVYVFGLAHMLIDINGWFPTGSDFGAVAPLRLVDTRPSGTKVGALDGSGEPLRINVLGKAGLPTTGVGAVSLNVTAVDGEIGPIGFVTVDGCTSPRPVASNLNFITGQTVPNAVITPVSPTGEICVYVFGLAHMLIDINGWFPTGSDFGAVAPLRLVDTRPSGTKVGALDGSGEPLRINVLGKAGLPTTGVGAVSLNVTAVDGEIGPIGFVTVDGCTSPRPVASNLNFITGQTVPNAVITPVSPTGEICVYVFGLAHMLIDINGWFPT